MDYYDSDKNLFKMGYRFAQFLSVINAIGIFVPIFFMNGKNWPIVLGWMLSGTIAILFCILCMVLISIAEEANGLKHAQLKANEIGEGSAKYLRYMAKQLSDKSGK